MDELKKIINDGNDKNHQMKKDQNKNKNENKKESNKKQ